MLHVKGNPLGAGSSNVYYIDLLYQHFQIQSILDHNRNACSFPVFSVKFQEI